MPIPNIAPTDPNAPPSPLRPPFPDAATASLPTKEPPNIMTVEIPTAQMGAVGPAGLRALGEDQMLVKAFCGELMAEREALRALVAALRERVVETEAKLDVFVPIEKAK